MSFWFGMFRSWIRERTDRRGRSSANTWIRWLNFGSGLFYLVGLCAFVVFLFMNTPGGDCVPRDGEDFYGEGYDGELEYRSELVSLPLEVAARTLTNSTASRASSFAMSVHTPAI